MSPESIPSHVGLIGLGLLGRAIAERLLQAGFSVLGFDLWAEATAQFTAMGGTAAASVTDIPVVCDRVVLSLPTSDTTAEVLAQMQSRLVPGTTIIDTTTGDPHQTASLAEKLEQHKVLFLDAAVLGSSDAMKQGDAVLLVGADTAVLRGVRDILNALSRTVFHLGGCGAGQQMKLVANLVLGLNRAALAEGLHLADRAGLDLTTVLNVLRSGAAWSRVMDDKGPRMIERHFTPQARLRQHLKDVRLILKNAQHHGTSLPLSAVHETLLEIAEQHGCGDLDNSAVIRAWDTDTAPD